MSGSDSSSSGTMTTEELKLLIGLIKKYKKLEPELLKFVSQSSSKKEKATPKMEKAKKNWKKAEKENVYQSRGTHYSSAYPSAGYTYSAVTDLAIFTSFTYNSCNPTCINGITH
ncbi:hypothetical protein JCGZ_11006 [Jatropha curcas]|uniref:Uncharacterized protein n=1 Tax=Jatropha curcas TaxID=180498 RepID=A0A067KI32_JATCU|nr:hypothetical protein JCGZ_11006 [Jatropha curcas]